MSLCWHSHPRSQAFVASVFSNSVEGLGKSSSRFHAHFSSKGSILAVFRELADKMDGARWFFKICVNTYVYIYIIYIYICVIHFLCISCQLLGQMNDQRYDFSMSISVREITSWCDLWFKWLKNKRSLMEWGYASMFAPRMGKISTPESLAIFFASSANSPRPVAACLSWGNRISRSTC